ncbi:flagellar export chaperone FliS [Brevibacillus ginsengisoli]|uniref:flagellar export chaperone FliS n=1 Tax=Brevibacillus ginsengisoli TaxID=363854 RepID=UPI003CE71757
MNNAAQAYQMNSINTASPADLTMMLYNGGIKFIKQTKAAIQDNKLDKAHEYNVRTQDILSELIITLNRDYPISEQFLLLYDYMLQRLVEANMKKDIEILEEVEGYFVQFRDTWREAIALSKKQE